MTSSEKLIREIEHFVNKIDSDEHMLSDTQLKQLLKDHHISAASSVSITEYHVLAYIGDHPATNAVSVSKSLGITRGGISKIAARLQNKGLIEVQDVKDNKREISYRLTPSGTDLYMLHTTLHKQKEALMDDLLSRYTDSEIQCIARFFSELTHII